ncbi:MAG: NAD-dependent epimerase/dehydratase family protein [Candidatus Lokiarchaeota archaeon]|nr:NAD-dependent epimerase/dehydratase family protein [Candidatus Lokiarchaeota archaeon]
MTDIKGRTVLVTGGRGFIGAHVARRYIAEGARVVLLDDLSSPNPVTIEGARFVEGSVKDAKLVEDVAEGADVISHQAAVLDMFKGIDDKVAELDVNVVGTINVLNAALKAGVKKVVYASSCGMYGQSEYIPQDEKHPKNPAWPYGITKYAGELYCQLYTRLHDLPTVSLRYSEVYGPGEWYGRVMTLFIKRLLEGKPPVIFGGGKLLRDYVFIDDVVEANVLATLNDDVNGMALNIGGPEPLSAARIAELACAIVDPSIKPVHDDPAPGTSSVHQPGRRRLVHELNDFVLDSSLARQRLGWQPKVLPEEGIRREVEWVKKHKGLWDVAARV